MISEELIEIKEFYDKVLAHPLKKWFERQLSLDLECLDMLIDCITEKEMAHEFEDLENIVPSHNPQALIDPAFRLIDKYHADQLDAFALKQSIECLFLNNCYD